MEVGYRCAAGAEIGQVSEPMLRRLEPYAQVHRFAYGQRVQRAGPTGDHVHYIRAGRVRAVLHGPGGQDKILAILDQGALIGDGGILQWSGPSVTYYAAELTETWSWPRSFLLDLLRVDCELAMYVLGSLSRKVQVLVAQIHALTFADAGERVVRTFVNLARLYGEPTGDGAVRIGLRLTQADVGEIANASRVTVNKVFQYLKGEKLMSKRSGYFIVHDLNGLSCRTGAGTLPMPGRLPSRQRRAWAVPPMAGRESDSRRS